MFKNIQTRCTFTFRGSPNNNIVVRNFSSSSIKFSGHNKWSTIKHDKAKNDAARNKISTRIANQITVSVRTGGIDGNPQLVSLLELAKKNNVPKKVSDNAIKRGTGEIDKGASESVVYEAMGPGGTAFIVEAFTDNKTRTVAEVKAAFTKFGGSFSPTAFMFNKRGSIFVEQGSKTFDEIFEIAAESGAEDVEEVVPDEDEPDVPQIEVVTSPQDTSKVANQLKERGLKITEVNIGYFPNDDMLVELDETSKISYDKVVGMLEEIGDVTDYYTTLKE